jgi:hypothetical protein
MSLTVSRGHVPVDVRFGARRSGWGLGSAMLLLAALSGGCGKSGADRVDIRRPSVSQVSSFEQTDRIPPFRFHAVDLLGERVHEPAVTEPRHLNELGFESLGKRPVFDAVYENLRLPLVETGFSGVSMREAYDRERNRPKQRNPKPDLGSLRSTAIVWDPTQKQFFLRSQRFAFDMASGEVYRRKPDVYQPLPNGPVEIPGFEQLSEQHKASYTYLLKDVEVDNTKGVLRLGYLEIDGPTGKRQKLDPESP